MEETSLRVATEVVVQMSWKEVKKEEEETSLKMVPDFLEQVESEELQQLDTEAAVETADSENSEEMQKVDTEVVEKEAIAEEVAKMIEDTEAVDNMKISEEPFEKDAATKIEISDLPTIFGVFFSFALITLSSKRQKCKLYFTQLLNINYY